MIHFNELEKSLRKNAVSFKDPFPHWVVDNFLPRDLALELSETIDEMANYQTAKYDNALEFKATFNNWNEFNAPLFGYFSSVLGDQFTALIEELTGSRLQADYGLHGGGVHMHEAGGKLNPHLDYALHPKLPLARQVNLICYLTDDWLEGEGGEFGLWRNETDANGENICGPLIKTVEPIFNRAVLFLTLDHCWHGLANLYQPTSKKMRKSLASYYLSEDVNTRSARSRALFAPTELQKGQKDVLELIKQRSSEEGASKVWVTK